MDFSGGLNSYEELNNLLKSVGSQEIYIFDANCIDAGRTNQEIRKINNYKEKIHKYISLGGDGRFIYSVENLDDYLLKLNLLISLDMLDRQLEFANNTYFETKQIIDNEKFDISNISKKVRTSSFIEENNSSLIDEWELADLIGNYYYEAYQYYCTEQSINMIKGRCGIVSVLGEAISSKFFSYTNPPEPLITQEELQKLTDFLDNQLKVLIMNPSLNSKKGRYIYYLSLLLAGEVAFWRGRFAQSIAYLTVVLDEWKEAGEESLGLYTDVSASIFSMLNILKMDEYVDLFYDKYRYRLDKEKAQYEHSLNDKNGILYDTLKGYNKMQLSKIVNRHKINSFITISLLEVLDYTKTRMYDTGLEYGDIDVSFGYYRIDIDTENDTLSLYTQREENVEKKMGATLIYNLSNIIERERSEFIKMFPNN